MSHHRRRGHYGVLPAIDTSGLWSHVANLRMREGDREGAARARLAARYSGSIRKTTVRWPVIRERRYTGTIHWLITVEWKGKSVPAGTPCNEASDDSQSTADRSKVNCGNCKRTKLWKIAEAEDG